MKRMKIAAKMVATVCIALSLFSCIKDHETTLGGVVEVGDVLPQFSVTTSTGAIVSNETLKGGIGVILFFYTPCSDCQQAMPVVDEVYRSMQDNDNVRWIAISRNEGAEAVASYWAEHNFTLPYSAQTDRVVYNLFAHSGVPRIYISDASGVVRAMFDDSTPLTTEQLRGAILPLLP